MKKFYQLVLVMIVSLNSFSQYYVYTATKSSVWSDMTLWNVTLRSDGIPKSKVVIPAPFNVDLNNGINGLGVGDADLIISGTLTLFPGTIITLSSISTVELLGSGRIIGNLNTEQIIIGSVIKYDGSLDLTKTGASFANSTTGISPNGFSLSSTLPVSFTSFTASRSESDVLLKWSTAAENENDHFDIERSYNGVNWNLVGTIKGAGSSSSRSSYSFTDRNSSSSSVVYYRLRQVDMNGAFEFSAIRALRTGDDMPARIYASGKNVNIELNKEIKNMVTVKIMNTNGQMIDQQVFESGYRMSINLAGKSAGVVIVNISDNRSINQSSKLVL